MSQHKWSYCPDPDGVDDYDFRPGVFLEPPKEVTTPFFVRCMRCGSVVMTERELFPDRCHEGWKMPVDCDETVVQRIMEE